MDREGNELTLPHLIWWDSGLNEQSRSARLRCFFFALKSRRLMRKWIMGQPLGQRWESNEEKCIDLRWGWNPGPLKNALTSGGDGTQALWKMHWPQVGMEARPFEKCIDLRWGWKPCPLKNALTSGGDGTRALWKMHWPQVGMEPRPFEKCIDLRWGWNPGPLKNALTSGGDGTQALWNCALTHFTH